MLLSLHGLKAPGRFEDRVFTGTTLVGVERYRSRIQATYAPGDWGGLTVRAAWSPSCKGAGVDLEVQASASSVNLLHDVEVMVQSRWERSDGAAATTERRVLPRDARAAAFSYDGREPAGDLRSLVTLALSDSPRFHAVSPPGLADGLSYLEMVAPNDVARLVMTLSSESRSGMGCSATSSRKASSFAPGCVAVGFARKRLRRKRSSSTDNFWTSRHRWGLEASIAWNLATLIAPNVHFGACRAIGFDPFRGNAGALNVEGPQSG
jgi:hypothetical protein